jgi:hypothetical protein
MDADVLRGLSHRPKLLSFEYHTKSPLWNESCDCFSEAMRLGFVEANFTEMINPEFVLSKWLEISTARDEMRRLMGNNDRWGDVVVR